MATRGPTPAQVSVAQETIDKFANRFAKHARRRGVDLWDLKQAGMLAAILAYQRYDESRAQWITHLYTPVRYAMLRELLRLGTPLHVHRDAYALGDSLRGTPYEDEKSGDDGSTSERESAIACRELLLYMESLVGADGARVLAASMIGAMTLQEASDLLGMSTEDFKTARTWVLHALRKRVT